MLTKFGGLKSSGIFYEPQPVYTRTFNDGNGEYIVAAILAIFNMECVNCGLLYSAGMSLSSNLLLPSALSPDKTTTHESENLLGKNCVIISWICKQSPIPAFCKPLLDFVDKVRAIVKQLKLGYITLKVREMLPGDRFDGHTDDLSSKQKDFVKIRIVLLISTHGSPATFLCGDGSRQQTKIEFENRLGGFTCMLSRHFLFHGPGLCGDGGARFALIFDGCRNMDEVQSLCNALENSIVDVGKECILQQPFIDGLNYKSISAPLTIYNPAMNGAEYYLAITAVQLRVIQELNSVVFDNIFARIFIQAQTCMIYDGSYEDLLALYNVKKLKVEGTCLAWIGLKVNQRIKSVKERHATVNNKKLLAMMASGETEFEAVSRKTFNSNNNLEKR